MQQTHIIRARLQGYRSVRDTEAHFEEGLNIIIGPNGGGKSNFLWLLANIYNTKSNNLRVKAEMDWYGKNINFNHHKEVINHIIVDGKLTKELTEKNKKNEDSEIIERRYNDTDIYDIFFLLTFKIPESIDCFDKGATVYIAKIKGSVNITDYHYYVNTNNGVINEEIMEHLNNKETATAFTIQDLNFDANVIRTIKNYTLVEDIRVESPFRPDEIQESAEEIRVSNLLYGFKINGDWYKWHELSDGTRRLLWITLNVLTNGDDVILIEEPELGVHPHQLKLLMEFLKVQAERKQIIITTHAPEALNVLNSDELNHINIAHYDTAQKTTVMRRIPENVQGFAKKYMEETGFLSDYWQYLNLEDVERWRQ